MTVELEDKLRREYRDLGVTVEAIDRYIAEHKQQQDTD